MTSVSPNRKAAASAALLILLLLPAPSGAEGLERVIHGETRCTDGTMRIDRDLRVEAGAALILEGCTLVMASPPYQDKWVGPTNEGLDIIVEHGGRLEMRPSATRASGIQPEDPRYGYTMRIEGVLAVDGQPGAPATIKGLEGFMAEAFLGGGLLVTGTGRAWLNHTAVSEIKGPAVFASDGGHASLRDVQVRQASGAFAATNATLDIDGADLNTGIESIRASAADLTLRNVTARTDRIVLHATRSRVVADHVDLAARNTIVLVESDLTLRDSTIQSIGYGLAHQPAPTVGPLGRIEVERCRFQPRPTVQSEVGVYASFADVTIRDTLIEGTTKGGVSVRESPLRIANTTFAGTAATDVYAADPTALELAGNTYSRAATRPVRTIYQVVATVLDGSGNPVPGAAVRVGNTTGSTDANGTASLLWEPPVPEDLQATAAAEATWDSLTLARTVTPTSRAPVFDFEDKGSPAPGALGIAVLAAAALLRRKAGGRGATRQRP